MAQTLRNKLARLERSYMRAAWALYRSTQTTRNWRLRDRFMKIGNEVWALRNELAQIDEAIGRVKA